MRFMDGWHSTCAREAWVAAALLVFALPALAGDDRPELCKRLVSLADASHDGAIHQVRIIWTRAGHRPACGGAGLAERAFCRWFGQEELIASSIVLSQTALSCLGLDPEPPYDPEPSEDPNLDTVVTNAWWSAGGFKAESGPLARDHLGFVMDMSIGGETGPWWILFTATPK
jgi:hypothetical protein